MERAIPYKSEEELCLWLEMFLERNDATPKKLAELLKRAYKDGYAVGYSHGVMDDDSSLAWAGTRYK